MYRFPVEKMGGGIQRTRPPGWKDGHTAPADYPPLSNSGIDDVGIGGTKASYPPLSVGGHGDGTTCF